MTGTPLAGTAFGEITDAVAAAAPTPGGGAVAGLTAALAAGLAAMVARYSSAAGDFDPAAAATRADELRRTAQRLADDDVEAYRAYLDLVKAPDPAARKAALDAAADIPLALAEVAVEVAELGELLVECGNPRLRPDALTAVQLGSAVAASAAALVGANLRARPDDPRPARAAELAAAAGAAAARVSGPANSTRA